MAVALAGPLSGSGIGAARFQAALAASADPLRFQDVPVDCWDAPADTWRPTAVVRGVDTLVGPRTHADVLVPIDDGVAVARVEIGQLRLSISDSDALDRFWTLRHRLRLMRGFGCLHRSGVGGLIGEVTGALRAAEVEARDVWLTAYAYGVPARLRRAPGESQIKAAGFFDECSGADDLAGGPGSDAGTADLESRAVMLIDRELDRLHSALTDAGLAVAAITAHPLVASLLNLAATAPQPDPPQLDPSIWGFSNGVQSPI
jgi:hypothetical protein